MAENTQPSTKGLSKIHGKSGTQIFNGIIVAEDYNVKLTGQSAIRIFEIMRRSDATVRATLQVCKLPILSAAWTVEEASDDDADKEIADFVRRELMERNVSFHDFIREGLTMLDFGFSIAEKTYELTEFEGKTRIGIQSIGFRRQKSLLKWETEDSKPGITQQLSGSSASIPQVKLVVFTNDKEGDNYEGISLLRYAYKHWDIKDKLDIINAIAIEKMAIGVPVLGKPIDADATELERAREALRNFRGNEEGYQEIPVGWTLDMLDMKANSTAEVIPTIQYHDRQIMKSVLAQFLELGASDASGSKAVSSDHSKLFILSEQGTAKNLQTTIQDQLIKQLVDLNYTDLPNGYPKLKVSKIGDEDITVFADAVDKFVKAGVLTPDADIESHVREELHLPELSDELKDGYEERRAAAAAASKALADGLDDSGDGTGDGKPPKKSDIKKEPAKTDPKKNQADLKAAVVEAQAARKKLLVALEA